MLSLTNAYQTLVVGEKRMGGRTDILIGHFHADTSITADPSNSSFLYLLNLHVLSKRLVVLVPWTAIEISAFHHTGTSRVAMWTHALRILEFSYN